MNYRKKQNNISFSRVSGIVNRTSPRSGDDNTSFSRASGVVKISFFNAGILFLFCVLFLAACSFDYGAGQGSESDRPDIVMENIEYVRVRGGDILARFKAEHAERWDERQIMELRDFSFEQMEDSGETVNVEGSAKAAAVQLDSGDITLTGGVLIRIESEDVTISTAGLEWKDKEKNLTGYEDAEVDVQRSDGTSFTGIGLSADIRSRTWSFSGEVQGTYVEEDKDEEEDENTEEENEDDEDDEDQ